MDQNQLESILADLSIGAVRYFDQVGSTNDIAAQWAAQGAPDLALVVADEQIHGRGRAGRPWYTPGGAALAFSIVIYPTIEEMGSVSRMTALGALAVWDALQNDYHLPAKIKWPNDIILNGKKVAGVLVEAQWVGDQPGPLILGIGINVAPVSMEAVQANEPALHIPVTCLENALGRSMDRVELLHGILADFIRWRSRLISIDFLQAWQDNLAYRDEWVQVVSGNTNEPSQINGETHPPILEGQIVGLSNDGSLNLRIGSGEIITLPFGEVRLRPAKKTTAEEKAYVR
jgi:BirA family transcriptional regulator, biotin operon repressor / biotin---[acetyl-CoA-carboxylase] ligase